MKLQMSGLNVPASAALQLHAERRFHSALSRILRRIGLVAIRVSDTNGARGGPDKRCDVRVQILGGEAVNIREVDQCMYRAIDRAAARVKRLAREGLRRQRSKFRRRRDAGSM